MFLLSVVQTTALASSLIGNPKLWMPVCDGSTVLYAPVSSLDWRFVSPNGTVQTVHTGACDLAAGCTAQAPFENWAEVSIVLPAGFTVETEDELLETVGSDTLRWIHTGYPSSWQGPSADGWLLETMMTLLQ